MSIAEAITNAQTRVNAVYDKCQEKGAKLPETKNLANLPSTIDTIPAGGGDVVKAYVSGVSLWKPATGVHGWQMTSVSDQDVLLTRVGYQATSSETLSPSVRPYFISEDGWACEGTNRYDIVDGVIGSTKNLKYPTGIYSKNFSLVFMNNGELFCTIQTANMNISGSGGTYLDKFSYSTSNRTDLNKEGATFLDFAIYCSRQMYFLNSDMSMTKKSLGSMSSYIYTYGSYYVAEFGNNYVVLNSQSNGTHNIIYLKKVGSDYEDSLLVNTTVSRSFTIDSGDIFVQTKGVVKIGEKDSDGYQKQAVVSLHKNGYAEFIVSLNDLNEAKSDVTITFTEYPEHLLNTIGNRTISKIQTFYDGTFSMDLSDGTTLICLYTAEEGNGKFRVSEIIEPFIIEGDSTIYHRTFSQNKLYWFQVGSTLAPASSYPWGSYTATKATVDWLAVPREQNRWNTTVLTGVVRRGAQTAKPEFDETNRRVIDVETSIKKAGSLLVGGGDWTLDDLDRVNGIL